ncbi:MAG: DUF3795 domain-containing protein [Bacteroidota bacterium]
MKNKSRRQFCQICFAAGAGLGSAALLASASSPVAAATLASEENNPDKHSDMNPDYSKIGYCGYRCDICPARSEDRNIRRKMVEGWKKLYGHTMYTEDNIPIAKPCAGCKGKGEIADTSCQARPCAIEKGHVICADCDLFPCRKLQPLLADRQQLLLSVKGKDVSLEEFRMSAMQFENIPVLLRRMAEKGKVPSWVKKLL